jgi:hypothetical protein
MAGMEERHLIVEACRKKGFNILATLLGGPARGAYRYILARALDCQPQDVENALSLDKNADTVAHIETKLNYSGLSLCLLDDEQPFVPRDMMCEAYDSHRKYCLLRDERCKTQHGIAKGCAHRDKINFAALESMQCARNQLARQLDAIDQRIFEIKKHDILSIIGSSP